MKNSLLIIILLLGSFFGILNNFQFQDKPVVNYTLNNSLPAFLGDTINIDFSFDSKSDLKYFIADVESNLDLNMSKKRIEFAEGRKSGKLSYSFVLPNTIELESILNFNFTVANKFSNEIVFISIPVYNLPHDVFSELEYQNIGSETILVESFFSSNNLVLTNELLADISEVEGYSTFKVNELGLFSLSESNIIENKKKSKEIIASNLTLPSEELIKNDNELIAANFISIANVLGNVNEVGIVVPAKKKELIKTSVINGVSKKQIDKVDKKQKLIKLLDRVVLKKETNKNINSDIKKNEISTELKKEEIKAAEIAVANNIQSEEILDKENLEIVERSTVLNIITNSIADEFVEIINSENENLSLNNALALNSSVSDKKENEEIDDVAEGNLLSVKLEEIQNELEQSMSFSKKK